ncbi:IS3 family transposase [Microbacterium kribbense]|uniref:IS3 family transposase n=1 Tax=Microbacterium kribbense TaxID=433645 RepID=UPI0031DFCE68
MSARMLHDQLLVPEIVRLHAENYGVYGVRKMHALMRRQGWEIGRDQTGRLMRLAGVRGVKRSKKVFTTKTDPALERPTDLVNRRFTADRTTCRWSTQIASSSLVRNRRPGLPVTATTVSLFLRGRDSIP